MSREITEKEFDEATQNGFVLVECYREGCVPCEKFKDSIPDIEDEIKNLSICTINIEEHVEIARDFNIMSVPFFLLFDNDEVVWEGNGFNGKDKLVRTIEPFIGD